jgi:hypothetical protein
MVKYEIELTDEQDALLGRAATNIHMNNKGAATAILLTALLHARGREIEAIMQAGKLASAERLILLEEADGINQLIGMGVLPLDHPDRLPLPLPVDVVPPVLAPEE